MPRIKAVKPKPSYDCVRHAQLYTRRATELRSSNCNVNKPTRILFSLKIWTEQCTYDFISNCAMLECAVRTVKDWTRVESLKHQTKFDIHGSVHRRLLSRNTNTMQLCNRIYYSIFYWRLNMFRAAYRPSSGALNCICSLWFICPCGDRPLPRLSGKRSRSALATDGHHMAI